MLKLSTRQVRWTLATLTFVTALVILLFAPDRLQYPAEFRAKIVSEILDSVLTAAIFYASLGLIKGRRAAWGAALVILGLSTIWQIVISQKTLPLLSLAPLAVFAIVASQHRYFNRRSERSNRQLLVVFLLTIATTLLGVLGYLVIALQLHRPFSLLDAILQSLFHMYSVTSAAHVLLYAPHHHDLRIIYLALSGIGVINYLLIALALLKPVLDEFTHIGKRDPQQLLRRYGRSSEDFFKLFPRDKSYFMTPGIDGFIAYAQSDNICLALAEPIAATEWQRAKLLQRFREWCHNEDIRVGVIPVGEPMRKFYEKNGLHLLKIGETALVDLDRFYNETVHNKHFRNIINRFEKSGATVCFMQPPHSAALLERLHNISDQWLARGHDERGFAMGYFDDAYLQRCTLVVAREADDRPIGFINLVPSYDKTRASFDLMRTSDEAPKNTIDFLLAKTCLGLHEQEKSTLDFGLAPLSGLNDPDSNIEKVLNFLSKRASRWYGFHGLRQFKNKFNPQWSPMYLAYEGGSYRLTSYAIALLAILDRVPKDDK